MMVAEMTGYKMVVCRDLLVELLDSQDYIVVPVRSVASGAVVVMAVHSHIASCCFFEEHANDCWEIVVIVDCTCYFDSRDL